MTLGFWKSPSESKAKPVQPHFSAVLHAGGLLDLGRVLDETSTKKVPTKVPADSHSKLLQKLCNCSSLMIPRDFEPKKSTNGAVFVPVGLFKVA
jgi:hypothetical protein